MSYIGSKDIHVETIFTGLLTTEVGHILLHQPGQLGTRWPVFVRLPCPRPGWLLWFLGDVNTRIMKERVLQNIKTKCSNLKNDNIIEIKNFNVYQEYINQSQYRVTFKRCMLHNVLKIGLMEQSYVLLLKLYHEKIYKLGWHPKVHGSAISVHESCWFNKGCVGDISSVHFSFRFLIIV